MRWELNGGYAISVFKVEGNRIRCGVWCPRKEIRQTDEQGDGSAVEGTHPTDEGRSGTKITRGRGNLLIAEDYRGRRVMHLEERRESLLKAIN